MLYLIRQSDRSQTAIVYSVVANGKICGRNYQEQGKEKHLALETIPYPDPNPHLLHAKNVTSRTGHLAAELGSKAIEAQTKN